MPSRFQLRCAYDAANKYGAARVHNPKAKSTVTLKRLMIMTILASFVPSLRTPRAAYVQSDYPATSFWSVVREKRRGAATIKFLGVSCVVFDRLCERMRPLIPEYDQSITRRGRKTKLDHVDATALSLRRLRICSSRVLDVLVRLSVRARHRERPTCTAVLQSADTPPHLLPIRPPPPSVSEY